MTKPGHTILPALLLTFAVPHLAQAQAAPSLSGLYACEALSTPDAQLSCFLTETAKLRAGEGSVRALAPTTNGLSAQQERLAVQQETLAAEQERLAVEKQQLAAEKARIAEAKQAAALAKQEEAAKPTKIDKRVERSLEIVSTRKFGALRHVRFTLANGEVWQQTETASVRLGKADGPDILVLKPKSFGYRAQVNDKGRLFRVKRIK